MRQYKDVLMLVYILPHVKTVYVIKQRRNLRKTAFLGIQQILGAERSLMGPLVFRNEVPRRI